jgi:hypothetical protein
MTTATMTVSKKQLFNIPNAVSKKQLFNIPNAVSNVSNNGLENQDDKELELEMIMFEEFAHGLPRDIPMAGI